MRREKKKKKMHENSIIIATKYKYNDFVYLPFSIVTHVVLV